MNYLKIIIGGRLTRDPETKTSRNGNSFTKFGIAVNTGWGDNKKTLFANVTAFGKRGDAVAEYFKKGDPILLECSSAEISEWTGSDGNKRTSLEIIADNFSFVGSASTDNKEKAEKEARPF